MAQESWSLRECIDYAIEHNLPVKQQDIKAAIKILDQEMALRERLPSVNGYANGYTTFGHSQDVFGTIRRNDNLNSNIGINGEVTLYQYHYSKNKAKKALSEIEQERIEKEILKRNLSIQVMESYLQVLLNRALVVAQDSAIRFSLQLLDKAEKSTAVGATAVSVVAEAKANLFREKQQYQQFHKEMQQSILKLAQLLNYSDYKNLQLSDSVLENKMISVPISSELSALKEEAYLHNPVFAKFQSQLAGIDLESKLIKSALYPTVKGSAGLGSTYFNAFKASDTRPFFVQSKDNFAQQLAVTVSIPIFNKGKSKRQLRQTELSKQHIQLSLDNERLIQGQILDKLLLELDENRKQYDIAVEASGATEESLTYSLRSFDAGRASIYDINTSKNNLIKAKSEMIRSRYTVIFNQMMLNYQIYGTLN
ncbi:TolC family protein [Sphingobacterium multivorum]|uniref:TolC family protein n=1 Tax=Sphingobacterium multivorum TaxID=28454 RepID=A0ABX7CJ94_SPHMU|nr:TolC family protein [Sphingobacterium multivorum]QQT31947.1 TolC family protein [Sphingobacterium multivorum]QQT52122.1 TolC family protein [Sphingobacterium multivorum]